MTAYREQNVRRHRWRQLSVGRWETLTTDPSLNSGCLPLGLHCSNFRQPQLFRQI